MKKSSLLLGFALLALCACVTLAPPPSPAPLATTDSDNAAKQFSPPEGMANVYIVHEGSTFGPKTPIAVTIDGKSLGALGVATYFCLVVVPGQHKIQLPDGGDFAYVTLDAKAGKNSFCTVSLSGAANAKPTIGFVLLDSMGKLMVRQYSMAQASR